MTMGSSDNQVRGLVVAGTQSGTGKTSISLALMAALKRKGLIVQAFKVGPDYIDPGHHTRVTGRPSHNLDGWMLSREENIAIFNRYAAGADIVIVEGVMGLYDGFEASGEKGSTAEIAKWLNLPVLLCVDARAMARSIAAVAGGFVHFDEGLAWAGLTANRVGSPSHTEILAEAMEAVPGINFIGGLVRSAQISMPERHLGLVTVEDNPWDDERLDLMADWLESCINVNGLIGGLPYVNIQPHDLEARSDGDERIKIGVARDKAFCFYYQENLRRLEEAGAELVFFSPVWDKDLIDGLSGLYIGGGYPELYARRLSENKSMLEAIHYFGLAGKPVYAECGGLMYLSRSLEDLEGRVWPMAGLLPITVKMSTWLRSLGYRHVITLEDSPLGPAGIEARGHEFHYSDIVNVEEKGDIKSMYRVSGRRLSKDREYGYMAGNVLASYIHLHFGSNPELARGFVKSCRGAEE